MPNPNTQDNVVYRSIRLATEVFKDYRRLSSASQNSSSTETHYQEDRGEIAEVFGKVGHSYSYDQYSGPDPGATGAIQQTIPPNTSRQQSGRTLRAGDSRQNEPLYGILRQHGLEILPNQGENEDAGEGRHQRQGLLKKNKANFCDKILDVVIFNLAIIRACQRSSLKIDFTSKFRVGFRIFGLENLEETSTTQDRLKKILVEKYAF